MIEDIGELEETLKIKSDEIIFDVIKAQRETAEKVKEDAVSLAPKDTGEYSNSIRVGGTINSNDKIFTRIYTRANVVSSSGKKYNLGWLLETGTSPHLILPVNSKCLVFQIDGKTIFTKKVHHPRTKAQPHFKTALDKNAGVYLENLRKAIGG